MNRILATWLVVATLGVTADTVCAQEFRLPSLIPFRKTTREVKPFQLTDEPRPRPGLFANDSFFRIPSSGDKAAASGSRLEEFNQQTKNFFSKTGENVSQWFSDTGKALKNLESPGWDFQSQEPRWNPQPDAEALRRELELNGTIVPLQPQPRTALQPQNGQPRHRF